MREINLIVRLRERVREGQSEVAPIPAISFAFEGVPVVADVVADAVPGELLGAVAAHLREAKYAHTLIVERVWLRQVQDIKLDG